MGEMKDFSRMYVRRGFTSNSSYSLLRPVVRGEKEALDQKHSKNN